MLKERVILSIVLAIILAAVGIYVFWPAASPSDLGWVTYEFSGYSFQHPESWLPREIVTQGNRTMVKFSNEVTLECGVVRPEAEVMRPYDWVERSAGRREFKRGEKNHVVDVWLGKKDKDYFSELYMRSVEWNNLDVCALSTVTQDRKMFDVFRSIAKTVQ